MMRRGMRGRDKGEKNSISKGELNIRNSFLEVKQKKVAVEETGKAVNKREFMGMIPKRRLVEKIFRVMDKMDLKIDIWPVYSILIKFFV